MKTTRKKSNPESRGTDDPFYKLMHAGGPAILKLLGVSSPESYRPEAVVLKEKTLYPDVVAVPEGKGEQVFIEFQGYEDPMIRYSLNAKIAAYCARKQYSGPTFGAVIYTDQSFQNAALPLEMKNGSGSFRIHGEFVEIVLSEYTTGRLIEIDPRLIVLAPFTISKPWRKDKLASVCREWKETLETAYDENTIHEGLEILGLFLLNRFRNLSLAEVMNMLQLNLEKTRAGKELLGIGQREGEIIGIKKGETIGIKKGEKIGIKKGEKKGEKKGRKEGILLKSRELLICALTEKFGKIPETTVSKIHKISEEAVLNDLFRKAIRSRTLAECIEDI